MDLVVRLRERIFLFSSDVAMAVYLWLGGWSQYHKPLAALALAEIVGQKARQWPFHSITVRQEMAFAHSTCEIFKCVEYCLLSRSIITGQFLKWSQTMTLVV